MKNNYSPIMSCCRSKKEHKAHLKWTKWHDRFIDANYTIIPPVSTGFGSKKMDEVDAIKWIKGTYYDGE